MQTDTLKYTAWPISPFLQKQVGGRRHFGFLQSANNLVFPSFGDVGKLQKLRKLEKIKTQAAKITTTFCLSS